MSASITNDATGTDLNADMSGEIIVFANFDTEEIITRTTDVISARKNPDNILLTVNPTADKNFAVKIIVKKLFTVSIGDGRSIFCPTNIEAICQTASQKTSAARYLKYLLFRIVIEIVIRQLSAYRRGILSIELV